MPKDRLAELQKKAGIDEAVTTRYRHGSSANGDASAPLLDQEYDFENFLERIGNIRKELDTLSDDLNKIVDLHHRLLSAPGADTEYTKVLNEKIALFVQRSRLLKESIKILDDEVKHLPGTCGISRAKKDQVYAVEKTLVSLFSRFNTEQVEYKEKACKKITEYLKIKNIEVSEDDLQEVLESGDISQLTTGMVMGYKEKKELYEDVKSRAQELKMIEGSVRELAEMFHDLHLLVVSQGEMIDHIETSVQNATNYAAKARGNVEEARKLQKKARKMKVVICIGAVVAIILLLIFLQGLVCHFTPIC